ncbi:MAG: uroporphyrinogen-III synthase [Candidatus Hinthialibacter antarcticus]|nr:uroporphyrinogen-III synthase [Candidatus Hinthialibacter antarcticus]
MSLNQKRLLLLRSEDDMEASAQAVRERGGVAVACPMICIRPPKDTSALDAAIQKINHFDWIVFTSPHAVRFFFQRVDEKKIERNSFQVIQIAAIGPSTVNALSEQKIPVTFQAEKANAVEFIKEFPAQFRIKGQRIFLPLSDIALRTMPDGLTNAGAIVSEAVAYENAAAESLPDEARTLLQNQEIDWALFTSPSTVRNLFQCLKSENINPKFQSASIGPSTSAALRELGMEPDVEADPHTFDGLLDAIDVSGGLLDELTLS